MLRSNFVKNNNAHYIVLRLFILICYIISLLIYFQNRVIYSDIFIINLLVTSIVLWLGPLRAIGNPKKIIDSLVIFYMGIFYYIFKGFSLAIGEKTKILDSISFFYIRLSYIEICLILLVAVVVLSVLYRNIKIPAKINKFEDEISLGFGYYLVIVVGLFSLFFLLRSLNFNLLLFLLYPNSRGYMGDNGVDGTGGLSFFFYYGFQLLGIALLVKLSFYGQRKRNATLLWYISTGIFLILLFLLTPRATFLGYIITLLIVYHYRIKKVSSIFFIILFVTGILYIYLMNLWRGIVGGSSTPSIEMALYGLQSAANPSGFFDKILLGTDLSDIRMFILIRNIYGEVLPLKYGITLLRVVYQFVPRFIWENKPLDLGVEIGQLFMPGTQSGTPPGFFAEMYINFSFVGVFLGTFLLGYLLKLFQTTWGDFRFDKRFLIFSIIAPRIFLIPSSTIANLITTIIIFVVGALICVEIHFSSKKKEHSINYSKKGCNEAQKP